MGAYCARGLALGDRGGIQDNGVAAGLGHDHSFDSFGSIFDMDCSHFRQQWPGNPSSEGLGRSKCVAIRLSWDKILHPPNLVFTRAPPISASAAIFRVRLHEPQLSLSILL